MNIVVKPVKCGDCSIVCGESEHLLIDCGSDNSGDGLCSSQFAFHAIKEEINNKEITNMMISHFHKDHFNGVLEIPDTYHFNTVYLPYSIIDGKAMYAEGMGRLLAIASPRSWGFILSANIKKLFQRLENAGNPICFVKAGDSIPFDGGKIRILWPEITKSTFNYDALPVKLAAMTPSLNREYISVFDDWEQTNSLKSIESGLAIQFNEIVGSEQQELTNAHEEFVKSFDAYLRGRHEGNYENGNVNFSIVNDAFAELSIQRKRFRGNLDAVKLNMINDFSRQQYHSLITEMNAISIVCDYEKRFIFLGDAPVSVVDHISPSFQEAYKFVKIQHHGTEHYFTPKTPMGEYNSISNGGYEKRKVDQRYLVRTNILCANAYNEPRRFCGYGAGHGSCSPNCIKVSIEQSISV